MNSMKFIWLSAVEVAVRSIIGDTASPAARSRSPCAKNSSSTRMAHLRAACMAVPCMPHETHCVQLHPRRDPSEGSVSSLCEHAHLPESACKRPAGAAPPYYAALSARAHHVRLACNCQSQLSTTHVEQRALHLVRAALRKARNLV
jgi:hypothetical protein